MSALTEPITIRPAYADDAAALTRLAALDSSAVPAGPLLVAEAHDELRAALSLQDGTSIADPFHHTTLHLDLLRAHAARRRAPRGPARHLRPGRRLRLA